MNYKDKPNDYFSNVRREILNYHPENAKKVLDVGCGNGALGAALKEIYNVEAWGIELMEEPARQAEEVLDKVFIGPCEDFLNILPDNYFDVIYFNDVLEHLFNPYDLLAAIRSKLTSNGVVISSIPNIRHYKTFRELFFRKNWQYTESGIMDFTHLRFFTIKTIPKMFHNAGYEVVLHKGINKTKSFMPYIYNLPLLFTAMDIFYLQFLTIAKKSNGRK